MSSQKIALTAFLFSPVVVIALLMYTMMRPPGPTPSVAHANSAVKDSAIVPVKDEPKAPAASPAASPPAAGVSSLVDPESLEQGFVIIVEDKSGLAKPESPIYMAGNFNNWNAGDDKYKLQPQSDMKWRIVLPKPRSPKIEFKFTRGSWELEELKDDMSAPGNRTLAKVDISKLAAGEQPKIELTVPHWGDERPEFAKKKVGVDPYRKIEVTGTIKRVQVAGGAGTTPSTTRDLLVWLPPGYEDPKNADKTYPVLYLHDGQNVFEQLPGVPGEWNADETATKLIAAGQARPMIIVGVPNSGPGRNSEYLPIDIMQDFKPQGDMHVDWLIKEVVPRIERSFRVKTGPEATTVGGSSLGALISLHAAVKHPEVFGNVLLESMSLRSGDQGVWQRYLDSISTWPRRVYLGVGDVEYGKDNVNRERNLAMIVATKDFEARLTKAGLGADRLMLNVVANHSHNESAWSARFPDALKFLFPPPVDTTK